MKKIVSVLLALVMVLSLMAGCGASGQGKDSKNGADTAAQAGAGDTKAASGQAGADGSDSNGSDSNSGDSNGGDGSAPMFEEAAELKMLLFAFGGNISDSQMIEDKLNEYIQPILNATVDIEFINIGSWDEQVNLKVNGGQQVDLMPVFGANIPALYTQEGLLPLDDLMAQYGQGIIDEVGAEYINSGKINGQLYSVVAEHEFAANKVFLYRKDIADKYDLDFSQVKSIEDLEPMLKVIKENEPDMDPLVSGGAGTVQMLSTFGWDMIGSGGAILDPGSSLTVENVYASDYYKSLVTLMHDWYEKGYIARDAATNTEGYDVLLKADRAFGVICGSKPGFVEQEENKCGKELAEVEILPAMSTTGGVAIVNWTIPVVSEYPEQAMALLNLMYTDKYVANLLAYGIEGVHYQMVDEANDIAGYMEGQDFSSCTYSPSLGWVLGGQFITHVWEGNDPDIWTITRNFNDTAIQSKALGFTYDSSPVQNEITAVNNVVSKYAAGLEAGSLDPKTELPKFINELIDAGINTIVETQQEQLNAWAKENGVTAD